MRCGTQSGSGTGFFAIPSFCFPLSLSFHRCCIFTRVSSGGWTAGPLAAHFHRDIVLLHRKKKSLLCRAIAQAERLVARPGFALRAVHVLFVVSKMALGHVFLRVLLFSPISIIPPLLHIHSCVIWVMDSGHVSRRSSIETVSLHRNNSNNNKKLIIRCTVYAISSPHRIMVCFGCIGQFWCVCVCVKVLMTHDSLI
jgi:hypothetical protein